MSRLREAFEKAGKRQPGAESDGTAGRKAVDPSLPTDWDFDLNAGETAHRTGAFEEVEPLAPVDLLDRNDRMAVDEEREVSVERAPVIALPRPKDDFWSTYQFGQKGIGKVVVGPGAESTLVEQYRRLGLRWRPAWQRRCKAGVWSVSR